MTDQQKNQKVNDLVEYLKYAIPKEPLNVMADDEAKGYLYILDCLNREDEVPDHLTHIELKQSEYLQGIAAGQEGVEKLLLQDAHLKLLYNTLLKEVPEEITLEDQQGNIAKYRKVVD